LDQVKEMQFLLPIETSNSLTKHAAFFQKKQLTIRYRFVICLQGLKKRPALQTCSPPSDLSCFYISVALIFRSEINDDNGKGFSRTPSCQYLHNLH
jgi:hypothetical protein